MSSNSNDSIINQYINSWSSDQSIANVISVLTKLSELFEKEVENYLKMDPDPFDDRHPSRTKSECNLGVYLKTLFKQEDFINKLVHHYLMNNTDRDLQITACRFTVSIMSGLEPLNFFDENDGLIPKIFTWAFEDEEPLQTYAVCLLASAMDVPELAAPFKDKNVQLVPIMIKKLKKLETLKKPIEIDNDTGVKKVQCATKRRRLSSPTLSNDCSNSSWAEIQPYLIGSSKIYPITPELSQRYIFRYLSTMAECNELLSHVFEYDVLSLILNNMDLNKNRDVRLALESIKYLSILIMHKRFAQEFMNRNGINSLLKIYRQSLAANGIPMCLNSLASHSEFMEKICKNDSILKEVVSYTLFLMESSHFICRTFAISFLTTAFSFPKFVEFFGRQDGLRRIINQIAVLNIHEMPIDTEDEITYKCQITKQVCTALKRYFETHLVIKSHQLMQSTLPNNENRETDFKWSSCKPIPYDYELITNHAESMINLNSRFQWMPVDKLMKYGGVKYILQFIHLSYENNFNGKSEAIRNALDILAVGSVYPKFQLFLSGTFPVEEATSTVGLRIILLAAGGEYLTDPECQRSALNIIINCVCGPVMKNNKKKGRPIEDINRLWNCVRFNNGIMVLTNLLTIKSPITDADSIRTLACKALCGLARCENVRQLIYKLPLFTELQIPNLMKEPVMQDKRSEHLKFCKYCIELFERVTGLPASDTFETSLGNLNKAEVIAKTKIVFDKQELLYLIYNHLVENGLTTSADALAKEANISDLINTNRSKKFIAPQKIFSPRISKSTPMLISTPNLTSNNGVFTPLKINRINKNPRIDNSIGKININCNTTTCKKINSSISLDSIITDYFRKQHALCKYPVVTCPPFNLFKPHRCPEPSKQFQTPINITSRLMNRAYEPPYGGPSGAKMDRKYIYSKFKSFRIIRNNEQTSVCSLDFSSDDNLLFTGDENGDIRTHDILTGEEMIYNCAEAPIDYIETSKDNTRFLISTCTRGNIGSSLWNIFENEVEQLMHFSDKYVEFGKVCQDKVLGTKEYVARLYDVYNGRLVRSFQDSQYANNYFENRATFHPSDYLILNDGTLWDRRSFRPVHKFDKLNERYNGKFHPNGVEIVFNSQIWDIKTFKLLKNITPLEEANIQFNSKGTIIYATFPKEGSHYFTGFESSFKIFDAYDYSNIATLELKRNLIALAVDHSDKYIATIETQNRDRMHYPENNAHVYVVGGHREEDEERIDDDSDESTDIGGDDDDDDNDDDDDDDDDDDEDDDDDDDDEILNSDSEIYSNFSEMEDEEHEVLYQINI